MLDDEELDAIDRRQDVTGKYEEWILAFRIFQKYDPGSFNVQASHDEVHAGPEPDSVSDDDLRELYALGWRKDEYGSCFRKFT